MNVTVNLAAQRKSQRGVSVCVRSHPSAAELWSRFSTTRGQTTLQSTLVISQQWLLKGTVNEKSTPPV